MRAMRKPRLYSIQSTHARECEQVLERLLDLARSGRITGLNWSALTDEREVVTGRAGVLKRNHGLALLTSSRKSIRIIDGDDST